MKIQNLLLLNPQLEILLLGTGFSFGGGIGAIDFGIIDGGERKIEARVMGFEI